SVIQPRSETSEHETKTDQRDVRPHPSQKRPFIRQVLLRAMFGWNFAMLSPLSHILQRRSCGGCRSFGQTAEREINDKRDCEADEPCIIVKPDEKWRDT